MPQKLMCTPNEPDTLITMSVESEDPGSSEMIACICFGGANCHTDDPNGPRNQKDRSHGKVDVSRGWADVPGMSNHADTAILGHRDNPSTHLGAHEMSHV